MRLVGLSWLVKDLGARKETPKLIQQKFGHENSVPLLSVEDHVTVSSCHTTPSFLSTAERGWGRETELASTLDGVWVLSGSNKLNTEAEWLTNNRSLFF